MAIQRTEIQDLDGVELEVVTTPVDKYYRAPVGGAKAPKFINAGGGGGGGLGRLASALGVLGGALSEEQKLRQKQMEEAGRGAVAGMTYEDAQKARADGKIKYWDDPWFRIGLSLIHISEPTRPY